MTDSNDRIIIDDEQFEEMKDLLEEDFEPLVTTYKTDSQSRIQEIQAAFQAGDNSKGYDAVHALKGASANLGAEHLAKLASQLQEACRNQKIEQSADLIGQLEAELTQVITEIDRRL